MKTPQHCAALLHHRLQTYNLPFVAVEELVNAFFLAATELHSSLVHLCHSLEDGDPERLELVAYYESQLDAWACESVEKVEAWSKPSPTIEVHADTLKRGYRPALERYIRSNAYPSTADKKMLAKCEGMSYRQVHVWFQNRRARAKEYNLPLPLPQPGTIKRDSRARNCSSTGGVAASQWRDIGDDERRVCLPSLNQKTSYRRPAPYQLRREPRSISASSTSPVSVQNSTPERTVLRSRKRSRSETVDELPAAFDAMNIRQPGRGDSSDKGYAACAAITYVAPKAPLPSLVRAPPVAEPRAGRAGVSQGGRREPNGRPAQQQGAPYASIQIRHPVPSASPPSRKPSLVFTDHSTPSSPEPLSPPELFVLPGTSVHRSSCTSNTRGHQCNRAYTPQHPSDTDTHLPDESALVESTSLLFTSVFDTPTMLPEPMTPFPAPSDDPLVSFLGDAATATAKDGMITFSMLDDFTLPDLGLDPNAPRSGPLDVQIATRDPNMAPYVDHVSTEPALRGWW